MLEILNINSLTRLGEGLFITLEISFCEHCYHFFWWAFAWDFDES